MKSIKGLFALLSCVMFAISATGCSSDGDSIKVQQGLGADRVVSLKTDKSETSAPKKVKKPVEKKKNDEEPSNKCSFICVGDNLIHDNIYKEALKNGGGKNYDFTNTYKYIEKYIKGNDVAVINQETLVTDKYEPSSYPAFTTPAALGNKIADMGFNAVSMCNNHVLDKGGEGLISSLDYWDSKKNIIHYGAYRDDADSEDIRIKEINGIKFAFLGYMEHTNGVDLDEDEPGKVTYLNDEDKIQVQIQKADQIADVVVVSCHYGTEVSNELNDMQNELTPKLVEWGADLIIGTQSHTVSTCKYMDKPDGGRAFVFYGLGNFISTMTNPNALVGVMGKLQVVKDKKTGMINFEQVKCIPVISHFEGKGSNEDWTNCTVYPYKDYTDELFSKHYVKDFTRESVDKTLSYIPKEFLSIE